MCFTGSILATGTVCVLRERDAREDWREDIEGGRQVVAFGFMVKGGLGGG